MYRVAKSLTKLPSGRVFPHVLRNQHSSVGQLEKGYGIATRAFATQASTESFLSGSSSTYVEEMYLAWQQDPNSVHKVWLILNLYAFCSIVVHTYQTMIDPSWHSNDSKYAII